jgi:hypothetical protein
MMIERMWRYCSLEHFHRTTGESGTRSSSHAPVFSVFCFFLSMSVCEDDHVKNDKKNKAKCTVRNEIEHGV